MTPKEKAEELMESYFDWYGDPFYFSWDMAKQCALIAVEEVIKSVDEEFNGYYTMPNKWQKFTDYWQEVKQEIEKL